jgi:hypothetical protein
VYTLHIILLILAFLLAVGAAAVASRPHPIRHYGLPLLAGAVAVYFFDLVLVAARVYG